MTEYDIDLSYDKIYVTKGVASMKNKANLPYIITVIVFTVGVITFILESSSKGVHMIPFVIAAICLKGSFLLACTACPIGLVFQSLHKNKTKFDKWILGLNLTGVIFTFSLLLFLLIAFPNDFKGEKDVRKQIKAEQEILYKEYQPVLDYLANYKKKYGVYPASIDNVAPKSKLFDKYEYNLTKDDKGYWLQVYTVNAPIEYYYNDEAENGYNYYEGDGYFDGFMDNEYYYQIDDKWHAIMFEHFTRHSKVFGEAKSEKETDTWMKNNVDKFDKK